MKITMIGPSPEAKGGISSLEKLILQADSHHMQFYHISTKPEGTFLKQSLFFMASICKTIYHGLIIKPDGFHIHFASRGSTLRKIILIWILILLRKKIILHAHGGEFHLFFQRLPQFLQRILKRTNRKSRALIVLSNNWKQYYVNHGFSTESNTFVFYNPVTLPKQTVQPDSIAQLSFLYLGKISDNKGVFDLIQSLSRIPDDMLNRCTFHFAGDGEISRLREAAAINEEVVTVLGWVEGKQKQALLQGSHVFILPSYHEGVPLAMLEAMAHGMAIITTPVGGIPEIIKDGYNGILVPPGDIDRLAEAIITLVNNPQQREALAKHARLTASQYAIDAYMEKLHQLYQKVLHS